MREACTKGSRPIAIARMSSRLRASVSSGFATSSDRFVAAPASSKFRSFHATASAPAAIDPPETLATRSSFLSKPNSLRRMNAPRWNSIARKPPPDRQRPIPSSSFCPPRKSGVVAAAASMGSVPVGPLLMMRSILLDQLADVDAYSLDASDQHEARAPIHRERRSEPAELAEVSRAGARPRAAGMRMPFADVTDLFERSRDGFFHFLPQTLRPADELGFAATAAGRRRPGFDEIDAALHQVDEPKQHAAGFCRKVRGPHL